MPHTVCTASEAVQKYLSSNMTKIKIKMWSKTHSTHQNCWLLSALICASCYRHSKLAVTSFVLTTQSLEGKMLMSLRARPQLSPGQINLKSDKERVCQFIKLHWPALLILKVMGSLDWHCSTQRLKSNWTKKTTTKKSPQLSHRRTGSNAAKKNATKWK